MSGPDISKVTGFNPAFLEQIAKKDPKEIKQFDSLEEAVNHANTHEGDETIVQSKDGDKDVYLVVNLKQGTKASDVFDPSQLNFKTAFVTRGDKKLEIVPGQSKDSLSDDIKVTDSLTSIAENDSAAGFDKNKATNNYADKLPAFQANLVTVLDKINNTEAKVKTKKTSLEGELTALKSANPKDDTAIAGKEKEISAIDIKLEELKTAKGVMRSKLLIMSQTKGAGEDGKGVPIPGSDLHVGDLRNKTDEAAKGIDSRVAELQTKLTSEKDPEKIKSLKTQISSLQKQSADITVSGLQIRQADLNIRLRVGSLATINSDINTAQSKLAGKVVELSQLQTKLDAEPRQEVRNGIEAQMNTLKADIDKTRTDLIASMNREIKSFSEHSPKLHSGGKIVLQGGAQSAVDLLNVQVKKLEAVAGKKPEEIDAAVKQVQTSFNEELLTGKVEKAGKYWDGISPKEAGMIKDVKANTGNYIKDYKVAQTALVKLKADIEVAKKLPEFKYSDVAFQNLLSAQGWDAGTTGLTGVDANKVINETYNALDKEFTKYLVGGTTGFDDNGIKNPVSNWMTYGKFASREAGSQIQNLEGAMEALKTLKTFDGNSQNDRRAVQALIKIMDTGPMTSQAMRMAATSMGIKDADKMSSAKLIGSIMTEMGIPQTAIATALGPIGAGTIQGVSSAVKDVKLIDGVINDLGTLHKALVKGNTEIYSNIVPAYEIFLKAESQGKNGVDALKAAGYADKKGNPTGGVFATATSKDPQGFVIQAFTKYREARNLEDKAVIAEKKGNPDEAAKLRKQRDETMHQANLMIGCQEQMAILQQPEIFGHPKVSAMLKAMTGTMSVKDLPDPTAKGGFRDNTLLSPNTGGKDENWADFKTRMGFVEVTAAEAKKVGGLKISGPAANEVHYFVLPDKNNGMPKGPNGTISQYFADNIKDRKMIDTPPRDMKPLYRDNVDGKVDFGDVVLEQIPGTTVVPIVYEGAKYAYNQLFN